MKKVFVQTKSTRRCAVKVRIKREHLKEYIKKYFKSDSELLSVQKYSRLAEDSMLSSVSSFPEEMEIEISESDIVKEKSNLEMWEEIFFDESRDPDEKAAVLNSLDYDPTQAYEKIVEGK